MLSGKGICEAPWWSRLCLLSKQLTVALYLTAVLAKAIRSWKSTWGCGGRRQHTFISRSKTADYEGTSKPEWSRTPGQGWDSVACMGATAISEWQHPHAPCQTPARTQGDTVTTRSSAPSLFPQSSISPAKQHGKQPSPQASAAAGAELLPRAEEYQYPWNSAVLNCSPAAFTLRWGEDCMSGLGLNVLHGIRDLKDEISACRARTGLGQAALCEPSLTPLLLCLVNRSPSGSVFTWFKQTHSNVFKKSSMNCVLIFMLLNPEGWSCRWI